MAQVLPLMDAERSDRPAEGTYYGRVEQFASEEGLLILDAVKVDESLEILLAYGNAGRIRRAWRDAFSGDPTDLQEALLFNLEYRLLTLGAPEAAEVTTIEEDEPWLVVEVSGEPPAEVRFSQADAATSRRLDQLFSMDHWPSATAEQVRGVLAKVPSLDSVVALDVGQGSANLLTAQEQASLYFDVGAGVYRNASTTPANLEFCACTDPPIVLSHWDMDHWAGAHLFSPTLVGSRWIAPRQTIGPRHALFAARILASGGRLHIVKRSSRPSVHTASGAGEQELVIHHGHGRTRNDSGLILEVRRKGSRWVLPGDADYAQVPPTARTARVLMATHHGATMPSGTAPPQREAGTYARLIYSFGPRNSYGHPSHAAIAAHSQTGWNHNGTQPQGTDVRSTGGSLGVGRSSIMAGWAQPAGICAHLLSQHGIMCTL